MSPYATRRRLTQRSANVPGKTTVKIQNPARCAGALEPRGEVLDRLVSEFDALAAMHKREKIKTLAQPALGLSYFVTHRRN